MKDIFEDIATVGTNFEQQLRIKLDQDTRDINQNYNQTQPQSNISQMIPMNVSFEDKIMNIQTVICVTIYIFNVEYFFLKSSIT
jgi:hypothetical protein